MLQLLDRIHPEVDTLVICTDVALLRYYIQEKLEVQYNINKNYSIVCETGVLYKKVKNDALVAPMLGDKWLLIVNLDKVGFESVLSLLNYGNGNSITLIFTEKYINYKKLVNSDKYKDYKQTIQTMYLMRFDIEDIAYLHKNMLNTPQSTRLSDDVLTLLCKNYRYDVDKVMDLFTRMRIGLKIESKQDLINEIGLGGVTAASLTVDLLRLFPDNSSTERRISNAIRKYTEMAYDLSAKQDFRQIFNQIRSTLCNIMLVKMLTVNGKYRRISRDIPEGYAEQAKRIKSLWRFDYAIRNEISIDRVLSMLSILNSVPESFDYEARLMTFLHSYISQWEVEAK